MSMLKYKSISLQNNRFYELSRQLCVHCKGNGTILVKKESPFYKGIMEYYQEKCPHCQ